MQHNYIARSGHSVVRGARAKHAAERLQRARDAAPEHRAQLLDDWLQLATSGEVRRYWRRHWGPMPGWAKP